MTALYREKLEKIRLAFPQPVSDRVHDSYFVHSIMRALDLVDSLKSELPVLGPREPLDYEAAQRARLAERSSTVEEVTAGLVRYFEGLAIWGRPRTQQNVVPPPTISSLIGILLSGLYNPNISWDEYSHKAALAEAETVAIAAHIVGYDPARASGVFTFGGTGTILYGLKLGLEKAVPNSMESGVHGGPVIFASDRSHYSRCYNVAGWLGIGTNNVISIPTSERNAMKIDALRQQARGALRSGRPIAGIIATLGTTDAFGLDDLQAIVAVRDERVTEFNRPYRPHVHADAVIGWAWRVFDDYDLSPAHDPGPRRGVQPDRSPFSCRLHRHRLSQNRVHSLYFESLSGQRTRGPEPPDAGRGADALSLPLRRAPARHVHAGGLAWRHGRARGAGQSQTLRQRGPVSDSRPHR
jgi:glutamate/tyrosine decarboxylase-like PLP-dependent enzyme